MKDPVEQGGVNASNPRDSYEISELAELLDTPQENVERWLREDGVEPLSTDQPDRYEAGVLERLRWRL